MKVRFRLALYVFAISIATGLPTKVEANTKSCAAFDLSSLTMCFKDIDQYQAISFSADIQCGGAEACCRENSAAIMSIEGKVAKKVLGNGHTFSRHTDQRRCAALELRDSKQIAVSNLRLDDDKTAPPCTLGDRTCAPTVNIFSDTEISLEKIDVFYGKGYAVKVWNTNGLSLINSIVSYAGEVGLYIGHYRYGPSHNIVVIGSTFAKSLANGVAIQGAVGTSSCPILIKDNLFIANHWHGVWPVANGPKGALTTGGQLLIADGANIQVAKNVIASGECQFCWHAKAVAAIELGDSPHAPGGVDSIQILDNDLLNGVSHPVTNNALNGVAVSSSLYRAGSPYISYAITQNHNTLVDNIAIRGNRETGFDKLARLDVTPVLQGNTLDPQDGDGGKSDLWVHSQANSRLQVKAAYSSYGAFGFFQVPTPDTRRQPLVWCSSTEGEGRPFVAEFFECQRPEKVMDVIGYTDSKRKADEKAAYLCKDSEASSRGGYLSWEAACDTGSPATPLGYAVEGKGKRNIR